jgi:hypothetical protein
MTRQGLFTTVMLVLGWPSCFALFPAPASAMDFRLARSVKVADRPAPQQPEPAVDGRLRTVAWDFGVAAPSTELRHRFSISNPTTQVWTVKNVNRTCACTVGEFSARRVRPSETISLEVAFRTSKTEGKVHESLMVEFQETEAPLVYLVMKGEVRGLLSACPSAVDFGRVGSGRQVSQAVELHYFGDERVTITELRAPAWLRAEHHLLENTQTQGHPRQAWKVVVHADSRRLKPGSETATLTIHTSSKTAGPAVIPVRVHVKGPLDAVPSRFDLGTVGIGQIARKMIMLEASQDLGELTEEKLTVGHDLGEELEVQISRTASPQRFLLTALFRPKKSRGTVEGELTIALRDKQDVLLRVTISGEVP